MRSFVDELGSNRCDRESACRDWRHRDADLFVGPRKKIPVKKLREAHPIFDSSAHARPAATTNLCS
jgi:hypothetical protein